MSVEFIRIPIPASAKRDLDRLCETLRDQCGLYHGQTAAAVFITGLRTINKAGQLYPSTVSLVSRMPK